MNERVEQKGVRGRRRIDADRKRREDRETAGGWVAEGGRGGERGRVFWTGTHIISSQSSHPRMSKLSPVDLPSLPSSFLLSLSWSHFLWGRSQLPSSLLISLLFCSPLHVRHSRCDAACSMCLCMCTCTMIQDERERKRGGSSKAIKSDRCDLHTCPFVHSYTHKKKTQFLLHTSKSCVHRMVQTSTSSASKFTCLHQIQVLHVQVFQSRVKLFLSFLVNRCNIIKNSFWNIPKAADLLGYKCSACKYV